MKICCVMKLKLNVETQYTATQQRYKKVAGIKRVQAFLNKNIGKQ